MIRPDYKIDMLCKVKEPFLICKVQKVPWKKLWAATVLYSVQYTTLLLFIVAIFWPAKVQYVVQFLLMSPWRDLDSDPEPLLKVVQPV